MPEKTHPEVVRLIIAQHGPISGKDVVAKCVEFGFTNPRSTSAILFNAKKAGTLIKDETGGWTVPPVE